MEPSNGKIMIKIKKQKLQDQYVLTNKHIVCKFKYLVVCFNHVENLDPGQDSDLRDLYGQLVILPQARFKELIQEQSINLSTTKDRGPLGSIFHHLNEWHPRIIKVECGLETTSITTTLNDYPTSWEPCRGYLSKIDNNRCILDDSSFCVFRQQNYAVVNINIYFELWKKIQQVSEYGVNFVYLRQMLADQMLAWNNQSPPYLDEVSVNPSQLPLSPLNHTPRYVYPSLHLIPMHY